MGEYMRTAVITWVISNLHMAKPLYPALIREGPGVTLVLQLVKGERLSPWFYGKCKYSPSTNTNTNTSLTWEGAGVTLVLQLVKGEETFL